MSDYSRILPAISHYESLARAQHGTNFVTAATAHFADMQAKYYSANDNPDYSSDTQKFCYLYKYAVAHGYFIYSTLKRLHPKIRPSIFSRNPTKIACIGGGPATEIIGLSRYLREMEAENVGNSVEITIFDREPSWKAACQRILSCVGSGLNITLHFVQFDATNPASYSALRFAGYHLVTANFFASELRKAKIVGASKGFWKHLFTSMGAGKIFLAVDFADASGAAWRYIDSVIPSGATNVLADEAIGMSCPDSKAAILNLENELDHRPKKNAQNFVRAVIT